MKRFLVNTKNKSKHIVIAIYSIHFSIIFGHEWAKRVTDILVSWLVIMATVKDEVVDGLILVVVVGVPLEHFVEGVPISAIEASIPIPEVVSTLRPLTPVQTRGRVPLRRWDMPLIPPG